MMGSTRVRQVVGCGGLVLILGAFQPLFAEILPPERVADWSNAGVQGGIPHYPVGVNVMNAPFGAAGNGTIDDTAAIQAAIAACPVNTAVFLPAGTYLTTGTLTISKAIVLRGEGPGLTRILHNHENEAILMTSGGDWAGIEDLHVETIQYFSGQSGYKIVLRGVQNSWVKNIESSGYIGQNVRMEEGSSHCEVRDSYIHTAQSYTETLPAFNAYGIEIFGGDSSYNLVENNVLDWFRHAMVLQHLCHNNVYAYNFAWNNWSCNNGCGFSVTTDFELHHYAYPDESQAVFFTLSEGNVFEQSNSAQDAHQLNTWLRNRVNNGGITLHVNNHAIGNELIEKKHPGTWNPGDEEDNSVRKVEAGSIAHGNFVTVPAEGLSWDPTISDHTIPNSYYLTSKPAFFGDLDWPPYGGDLMPGNTRRSPAEVRYWTMLFPEITPSNLQANVQGNAVVLTWDNNSVNTVDFVICRSLDNVSFERIGETFQTTYTDTVAGAGQYFYYVRARNHLGGEHGGDLGGESDPSGVRSVTVAGGAGLTIDGSVASEGDAGASALTFSVTLDDASAAP
jgi:hypothetical protein